MFGSFGCRWPVSDRGGGGATRVKGKVTVDSGGGALRQACLPVGRLRVSGGVKVRVSEGGVYRQGTATGREVEGGGGRGGVGW